MFNPPPLRLRHCLRFIEDPLGVGETEVNEAAGGGERGPREMNKKQMGNLGN